MKTKDKIAELALQLFNQKGFSQVSLREIAKNLAISYGNLCYHYPNKETIIKRLYQDMMLAHQEVSKNFDPEKNLLLQLLNAPAHTFEITKKYLFLFFDYSEIIRQYPAIHQLQIDTQTAHQERFMDLFQQLTQLGYLREDLSVEHWYTLMELSAWARTFFFFQQRELNRLSIQEKLKKEYITKINRVLYPYLSPKGLIIYQQYI